MIPRRNKIHRGLIVMASAGGSIAEMAQGMWKSGGTKRWILPLAVFLCMIGVVLILAVSVEALAPFIYAIF